MPSKKPARLAVIGRPILHSKSPRLFRLFFRLAGRTGMYSRLAVDSAGEGLRLAGELNLRGLNITMPYKSEMARKLDWADRSVVRTGVVNTLVMTSGGARGFNTDGQGIRRPLARRGILLEGESVLILGAGGAAAAVLSVLKGRCPRVTVANRNIRRARRRFAGMSCRFCGLEDMPREFHNSTLIINTLPLEVEPPPGRGQWFFEAGYQHGSERADRIRSRGYRYIGGLEWLVDQGRAAFHRFFPRDSLGGLTVRECVEELKKESAVRDIALVGFMGAGKTTVGRILADRLGFEFLDSDRLIEKSEGRTVAEIFHRRGEDFFRRREEALLARMGPAQGGRVLATGGGLIQDLENRRRLAGRYRVIWLYAPFPVCLSRSGGSSRPLLLSRGTGDSAALRFDHRQDRYFDCADLIIANTRSAEGAARRIQDEICAH